MKRISVLLVAVAALTAPLLMTTPSASAASSARVSISGSLNASGSTTLTLRGSGFQDVKGGFGGIYVLFGTVNGNWRPSQGGASGRTYFTVPDSQTKGNAGYQKFVAFTGDSTASSANGGMISADGTWATQLVVPGPTFTAVDSSGKAHPVDCRVSRCGVITVGAHGVANAANESFTAVSVSSSAGTTASSTTSTTTTTTTSNRTSPTSVSAATPAPTKRVNTRPQLQIDRASATAGKVLAFSATGLPAGRQVSAVLDAGSAGAGPFTVAADGSLSGLITLPATLEAGTHQLRLSGAGTDVTSAFGATAAEREATQSSAGVLSTGDWFVLCLGGALLALALLWRFLRRPNAV